MLCFQLEEFHDVMARYAVAYVCPHISPYHFCQPGSILFLPNLDMDSNEIGISPGVEVAHIPGLQFIDSGWMLSYQDRNFENICTEMENGWIRFWLPRIPAACKDFIGRIFSSANTRQETWTIEAAWLSQANHIFSGYGIKNDLSSYAFIESTSYWVSLLASGRPPAGTLSGGIFLFLSPIGAMQNCGLGGIVYPVPAFWSFDPSGSRGLLPEDAIALGLPILSVSARTWGSRWSTEIYCGLGEFYRCKGFSPEGFDVALHLRLPMYQPSLHDGVYPLVELVDEEEATDSDADSV
ncbi:hypothetical protein B0H11DRAFT_2275592 [Mycena galericulata]|nr:hypothetical protein B0H11DRAFT_2275592 [Mycena galericulata]